jgi:hypothetical protein
MSHRAQVARQSDSAPTDWMSLYALAARAQADPRSVLRVLRGGVVRGSAGARIARVLADAESEAEPARRAAKKASR